jgi:hypothetical protein
VTFFARVRSQPYQIIDFIQVLKFAANKKKALWGCVFIARDLSCQPWDTVDVCDPPNHTLSNVTALSSFLVKEEHQELLVVEVELSLA